AAPKTGGGILAQGSCGENLTYVLKNDGTLTISGSGAMADYSASAPAPWSAQRQNVKTLVIESGASSIGAYAFDNCGALSAVTIPNSLTAVAPHAFDACAALENVSYDGTEEQWDSVIFNTSYNDALEFATVRCGEETYNAFRSLGFFGKDGEKNSAGKMAKPEELTWRFAVPLNRFRNLYIDAADAENAPAGTALVRKASADELSRAEGSKEYAATSGSTVLTIPAETFETFQEGSHNITATFQTAPNARAPGDNGFRKTSAVYTIFPDGPIDIDESELTADAVRDVSYTGRLQTKPKLSDDFYRFELAGAKLNGQELTLTQQNGGEQTENETADKIWKLGTEEFFFHPNGRFSGIPSAPGEYELTVELKVREERDVEWHSPKESSEANPRVITLLVAQKSETNISTTSEGYEVIQGPPATLEQGTPFQMMLSQNDPEDKLVAVYIDSELLTEKRDYTVSAWDIQLPRLLDGGILTQLAINIIKTDISLGLHSVNVELEHKDPLGNTQTKSVARPLRVTEKKPASSGGGGGSSRTREFEPKTYAVNVSKVSNGKITLSASQVAAGKRVTITVTPNSGYRTEKVSVIDSAKKSVKATQSGNQYTFAMPSRAVTVSASFTPSVYSVTVAASQHGKVTLNRASASRGAAVNGSAAPDKGYLLQSVAVRDASGRSVRAETFNDGKFTFLMPEGRVTVSATFTVKRLASFSEIQGPDWFFDDAEWAYNRGILRGVTEQYWEPHSLMSSVTSIVTLERLDGVDLTPYDNGADDGLDNGAWYVAALRWANANRITLSDRPFGEREAIKRGEFAVMLSNYLRYRGITPEVPADADAMTEEELHAFLILRKADVFRGYSDGSIRPETNLNRAQLAALLHRL
ncbi:MAG: leucine-rich repeat protein, partial [Oscillospiraceae bacterium]|nr:leucine-rich repeat protein [Oscillospiraceae bacterium]